MGRLVIVMVAMASAEWVCEDSFKQLILNLRLGSYQLACLRNAFGKCGHSLEILSLLLPSNKLCNRCEMFGRLTFLCQCKRTMCQDRRLDRHLLSSQLLAVGRAPSQRGRLVNREFVALSNRKGLKNGLLPILGGLTPVRSYVAFE